MLAPDVIPRLLPSGLTVTTSATCTLAVAVSAGKTLTLTATDNYNLTIPATGTAALLATANTFTAGQSIQPAANGSYNTLLNVNNTYQTDVAANCVGVNSNVSYYFTNNNAYSSSAGRYYLNYAISTGKTHSGLLVAMYGYTNVLGTSKGTATTVISNYGILLTAAGAEGVITSYSAFRNSCTNAGTVTYVTYDTLHIQDSVMTGTTQHGIYVDALTSGTTNYVFRSNAGLIVFNESGDAASDVRMEGDTLANLFMLDVSADSLGINVAAGSIVGMVHIDQSSTTGAKPVLTLDQADVSEEFIRFIGSAANDTLTQSLVAIADVSSAVLAGYLKVYIQDDGNQITDGVYYMPFYTLA